MQRTGGKNRNEISKIFSTLGMSVCKSYADYTGKPSSDHDIQLMVYSVRSKMKTVLELCRTV